MTDEIVTVFRSRVRPEAVADYHDIADRMSALAESMPGFVEQKRFTADDGERVTLVRFESLEHQHAWRDHPEHREAQARGRAEFYSEYDLRVARVLYHSAYRPD